jgi:hypothetical protein
MWTFFAILSIIIIGLFVYVKTIAYVDTRKYLQEYGHIFDAHEAIGYPALTNDQQFDILDNENTKHISTLTKYDFIPTGLLNYYINISPDIYFNHLKTQNLKEKLKFDPNNLRDGFFIEQTSKGFNYLFVERQAIIFRKRFSSYDRLLKYIVHDRLNIYTLKKYKQARLKKYYA